MSPRATKPKGIRSIPDTIPADNRTLGWAVLEWTAEYLLQPDGPNAGEPWDYTDEQVRVLLRWYQIDERGRFVYRRGVLRRMKGWGKDPFTATLSTIELCGPCRFGGFNADKMPVAIPHPAPWIQIAAVSKDQTRNTMTLFPGLFSKQLVSDYGIDPGKEIIYAQHGKGRIEAVTSSPRALEGGRPSLVVKNETHHWIVVNEGIAMTEAIDRNLAKGRDASARSMEITNGHLPGEGSAAEITYEAWQESGGKVAGLYYDSLEAPAIKSLEDHAAVRRGLLAARGDSTWLDVDRLLEEIADPTTPEWMSRRFYLNQIVAVGREVWLGEGTWEKTEKPREVPDGEKIVLGFDGSYDNDSTALVGCTMDVEPYVWLEGIWECPVGDHNWRAPRLDIMNTIRQACKRWRAVEIACDPYIWQSELEALLEEGLPIVVYEQKSGARMIAATQRFKELATSKTEDGRPSLTHDANPRFARHIGNAHTKTDSRGSRLAKPSDDSPLKIDAAVAAVMAVQRAAELAPKTAPNVWDLNEIAERLRREDAERAAAGIESVADGLMTETAESEPLPQPTPAVAAPPKPGEVKFIPLSQMPPRR